MLGSSWSLLLPTQRDWISSQDSSMHPNHQCYTASCSRTSYRAFAALEVAEELVPPSDRAPCVKAHQICQLLKNGAQSLCVNFRIT